MGSGMLSSSGHVNRSKGGTVCNLCIVEVLRVS